MAIRPPPLLLARKPLKTLFFLNIEGFTRGASMKTIQERSCKRAGTIEALTAHSPLLDTIESIGGIRATVHVAVLSASRSLEKPDAYQEGDSLVRECALRRLREDLPYLLVALGSPEGSEPRAQAAEGLRILHSSCEDGEVKALASRVLSAMGADVDITAFAPDPERIRRALQTVEGAERAMGGEMDRFEDSRAKIARHRAYEHLETLLPQMLLALDSDPRDPDPLRGLTLLRDRLTMLVRPASILAGNVLGNLSRRETGNAQEAALSVDLAQ